MTWWRPISDLLGGGRARTPDFLAEALDLEARGDYANALTSYRLALRERPDDPRVLQNIAIAFSKTGQPEEAIRSYRRALAVDDTQAGAHYGLAFLLAFAGAKLILSETPVGKLPIWLSLSVIIGALAVSIVWSLVATRGDDTDDPDRSDGMQPGAPATH